MKKAELLNLAYEYGAKAFEKGIVCAPANDKEFLDRFIAGAQVGNKDSIKYMKEWTRGWTVANLAN